MTPFTLVALSCTAVVCLLSCSPQKSAPLASPTPSSSRTLRLSRDRVPGSYFHLKGLVRDARFIKDTATGSFTVRPRRNAPAGGRLRLKGAGCRDADSVYTSLYFVEPIPKEVEHVHDRTQKWVATRRFAAGSSGWSGILRVPARPGSGQYGVWAVCEKGGHAYYPSGWDVYVGHNGP